MQGNESNHFFTSKIKIGVNLGDPTNMCVLKE